MALGDLLIKMGADVAQFQADLGKAVHLADQTADRIKAAFSRLSEAAGVALAGFSVKEVLDRTVDAERAMNRMQAALTSTGHAAGLTTQQLDELSDSLKKASPFDDDEIRKGLVALLRFRDVQGETFREGAKLAVDLASALGEDVVSSFQKVGKALTEPSKNLRGMKDAGVELSDQQIELAKRFEDTGQKASAQKLTLDALRKSVGGAASAENQGLYGSVKGLEKAWDELLKTIGKTPEFQSKTKSTLGFMESSLLNIQAAVEKIGLSKIFGAVTSPVALLGVAQLAVPDNKIGGPVTGKIGGYASEEHRAAIGRLQRQIEQAQETAQKNAENARKREQAFYSSSAENSLQIEHDIGQQRERLLDQFRQQDLVGIRDYFDARRTITQERLSKEVELLQHQIEGANEALNSAREKGDFDAQTQALIQLSKLATAVQVTNQKAAGELASFAIQEKDAMSKLDDEVKSVTADLLELQGQSGAAAEIRVKLQNRERRARFKSNDNQEGLGALDLQEKLTVAQAQFNQARQEQEDISSRLGIEEERIQNSLRVGSISELDALKKTADARAGAADQLDSIVTKLQKIAEESKNPALILQAEQARAALERLRSETDLLAQKFDTIFKDSFTDAFSDFISGSKNAKDAFKAFADSVTQQINKIISQAIATDISNRLGIGPGSSTGGLGGIAARIFGGPSGGLSAIGAATGVGASDYLGQALASGVIMGPFDSGTDYVPRTGLAMIHKGEQIIPAGGQSGDVIHINIQTPDAGSFRRSEGQIAAQAARMIQTAKRNL